MNRKKILLMLIAEAIWNIEINPPLGRSEQDILRDIQNICSSLSLEDMLWIDEYLMNKKSGN